MRNLLFSLTAFLFALLLYSQPAHCVYCPTYTCFGPCGGQCTCVTPPGGSGGQCWGSQDVPWLEARGWSVVTPR